MTQKSKSQLWRESLETKAKKMNKKDLRQLLTPLIISIRKEGKGQDKMTIIEGRNYLGRTVILKNRKEDEALKDLATLNGIAVE